MSNSVFEEFLNFNKIKYRKNEPMCKHTSFKIGGPVDYFLEPKTVDELCNILKILKSEEIPLFVIGKGSNLLVSDKGIEGTVISLGLIDKIFINKNKITAFSGASLAAVCVKAMQLGLSGIEFAYGIPGTVGGALFMNAGAYGGEMSKVVESAEFVTLNGEKGKIYLDDMQLGYRNSIFKTNGKIITSVTFNLSNGKSEEIKSEMDDFMERRRLKQPLEYPSAGSTFKRPIGYFAGALIEKNNLKSVRVGGAMVSEKHAGFVINYDNATCEDVRGLMQLITDKVSKNDGVILEPEVIFVGRR